MIISEVISALIVLRQGKNVSKNVITVFQQDSFNIKLDKLVDGTIKTSFLGTIFFAFKLLCLLFLFAWFIAGNHISFLKYILIL